MVLQYGHWPFDVSNIYYLQTIQDLSLRLTRLRTSYATDGESKERSFVYVPTMTERTPVASCDWDQNFM
jgi:hypothetical protein